MNTSDGITRRVWWIATAWLLLVSTCGYFGLTTEVPALMRGPLVAIGIATPYLAYVFHAPTRALFDSIPDATIVAMHAWRAVAGFAFLYCGTQGLLPAPFVINAGYGDLIVAALVPVVLAMPESRKKYLGFHIAGLADFCIAVGTGLYFTVISDPLMDTLFAFPMVLIPWFGVSLSGASHLIVLHRLLATPHGAMLQAPAVTSTT